MLNITKKDKEHIDNLRSLLQEILTNNECKSNKEKFLSMCNSAITIHGEDCVSKAMLESLCADNNIPPRIIRDLGGVKAIKQLILESK